MGTRTQLEFYDEWDKKWHLSARLYHHFDGYPSFMMPTIEKYLKAIKDILTIEERSYWWDGERVASLFVALSRGEYEKPQENPDKLVVPRFQPSQEIHGDIEYLYKIKLLSKMKAKIEVYQPKHDEKYDIVGFRKMSKKQLEKAMEKE